MLRNSMGACAMVRMGRNTRGRGRPAAGGVGGAAGGGGVGGGGFYPLTYPSPSPRYIYPTSPSLAAGSPVAAAAGATPQFYQTTPTAAYFDTTPPKRGGEDQVSVPTAAVMELPHHPSAAATITTIKSSKNGMQVKLVCLACPSSLVQH